MSIRLSQYLLKWSTFKDRQFWVKRIYPVLAPRHDYQNRKFVRFGEFKFWTLEDNRANDCANDC